MHLAVSVPIVLRDLWHEGSGREADTSIYQTSRPLPGCCCCECVTMAIKPFLGSKLWLQNMAKLAISFAILEKASSPEEKADLSVPKIAKEV